MFNNVWNCISLEDGSVIDCPMSSGSIKKFMVFLVSLLQFERRLKSKEAGYVPANYVKEIEPRIVKKTAKEKTVLPEKVKRTRKVKKTVTVQKQRLVAADKREPDKGAKLKKGA